MISVVNRLTLYLLLWSMLVATLAWTHPKHNFDLVFYVASALAWQEPELDKLHRQTYATLQQDLDETSFAELTAGSKPSNAVYRSTLFQQPQAFAEQLPFYRPRILYNGLIFGLAQLQISPVDAIYAVSLLSTLAALWIYLSLFIGRANPWGIAVAVWILAAVGFYDLARFASPDALAFLAVALLNRGMLVNPRKALAWAPLLVLIRTDLLILNGIYALYYWRFTPSRWLLGGSLLVSAALYWLVNHFWGGYGWLKTVFFTFGNPVPFPSRMSMDFSAMQFVQLWWTQFTTAIITDDRFVTIWVLVVVYAVARWKGGPVEDERLQKMDMLLWLGVVYIVVHILLFPASWERFFMAQYSWIILSSVLALSLALRRNNA